MKNALLFVLGTLAIAFASSTLILYQKYSGLTGSERVIEAVSTHITNNRVSGQVFVVARNGASIPLGGIAVVIHPFSVLEKALPAIYQNRAVDITQAANIYIQRLRDSIEKTTIMHKYRIGTKSYEKASNEWNRSIELRNNSYWNLLDIARGNKYYEALPEPSMITQTDASGKFEFDLPASTAWVVSACASRLVGDSDEKYCWFVKPKLEKEILLNNNNMFGTYSDDSLIMMRGMKEDCGLSENCIKDANQLISLYAPYLPDNYSSGMTNLK
jgi:hypothetical protein